MLVLCSDLYRQQPSVNNVGFVLASPKTLLLGKTDASIVLRSLTRVFDRTPFLSCKLFP